MNIRKEKVIAIFKKELAYYVNNPAGYIVMILFAIFANFLFMKDIYIRGNTSMRPFFDSLPWLCIVFVPAVCMRLMSEEKRMRTFEVLMSLPIKESELIVGKYLAAVCFCALSLGLTLSIPATLFYLGSPILSEIIISYMGGIVLIAFYAAISIFFSSITANQVVAFLSSIVCLFLLTVIGGDFAASVLPLFIREHIIFLSPLYHYSSFLKGIFDLRAVFYFASLSAAFLFLAVIHIEKRD